MWSDRMYYYPVQETFRYHFQRSPSPKDTGSFSYGRDSLNRRYPYIDKPYYNRSNPMAQTARQNEVAELDQRVAPDYVIAGAPFGNDRTRHIEMRLLGGKYCPAYVGEQPKLTVQPIYPITLPPQQIDPRSSLDANYYKDAHEFFSYEDENPDEFDPTTLVNKRPDSKDVARLPYKTLPPIQQNRTRNDMSTVFEAEPWTHNKQPSLARETEYKTHYNPELDQHGYDHYQPPRPDSSALYVSEDERRELLRILPSNAIISSEPIKLSRDLEITACKLICQELGSFEQEPLRDIYIECSHHDKHLNGFCTPDILEKSFQRQGVFRSNSYIFRLIASLFVDPRQAGKVNYEKFLSFVGTALKMHSNGQLKYVIMEVNVQSAEQFIELKVDYKGADRPRYYMQNGENLQTGSIYKDREVAKLLRMVEQELSKSTYQMDWTRWQNLFHEKDRDHRGTLSGSQIKDICYDCRLPLPDSLINQILSLCEDNNRDGQYSWTAFFKFLDKIQPSNTGLPIPVSKRPLEYAKHYPQPVANWPRSDSDALERKGEASPRRDPSPRRDQSPRRGEYYKQENRQQQQQQYDERVKSPPRDKPPTPERKEKQSKVETMNRHKYSPERQNYHRSPDEPKPRSYNHHHPPPSPSRNYVSLEQYELDRRMDEFEQNKQYQSGGYKPSWQENDERDRRARPASPKWAKAQEQEPTTDRQYNTKDPRYMHQDPYDRAMQAWVQQHRVHSPYGVQRRNNYNRPYSYAEPQRRSLPLRFLHRQRPFSYRDNFRDVYQDTRFEPLPARTRTPVQRSRSLSPVRFVSPVPGQQRYPNTHREYPSTHREQQQYQNPYAYRQGPYNQQMYANEYSNYNNNPQQHIPYYQSKAPYAFDKDTGYTSINSQRQLQPNPGPYPQDQLPRYGYADPSNYNNPAARVQYGQRDAWYESQQYRSPPQQYPDERYRRYDDRGGYQSVRDDKIRQLSNELGSLETKYKITKDSMKTSDQPWLQRYLKLAEALYNIDIHNSGCLPRTNVMEIVRQYNDAFNLNLDMTRANMLAISPENLDRSGNVILRPYLAGLCGDNFKDKP